MRFFRDGTALETLEWLAAAAVIVALAFGGFALISTAAKNQGSHAKTYIDSIPTPAPFLGGG